VSVGADEVASGKRAATRRRKAHALTTNDNAPMKPPIMAKPKTVRSMMLRRLVAGAWSEP